MMQIVKKNRFTLLEILIVLLLLSFGVILTSVKIKEMYEEQRFLSEAQEVVSYLAMAQDLMLIMDTDVKVKMVENPESKRINVWLEIEKPLEKSWARLIERRLELKAIQSWDFEGTLGKDLTLQFSLGNMSKGILTLFEGAQHDSHQSDKRDFKIELVGYPSGIGKQEESAKQMDKTVKSRLLYPSEVYEELYEQSDE